MENNPYNRNIAAQLKMIDDSYLSHLNKTGKQVVDSDLVPLVKPNIKYEANGFFNFDDMVNGLSTGFQMPLKLVNKVLGGKKEAGIIKIAKGKAHYGKESISVKSGNCIGRAVGSGNKSMEGSGIFDEIGDLVSNVKKVLPLAAVIGIGKKGRGRPRKAGSVGVQSLAENKNALTGGKKRGRPSKKQMEGGGPISSILGAFGLGKIGGKKRGRPSKKQMEGSGIFDDILSSVGKVVKTAADVAPDALSIAKLIKGKGKTSGGAKAGKWIEHVKSYAKKNNISFKDALKQAKSSY
jgi:hypothetical protein